MSGTRGTFPSSCVSCPTTCSLPSSCKSFRLAYVTSPAACVFGTLVLTLLSLSLSLSLSQTSLDADKQAAIAELLSDEDKAKEVIDAANTSMGTDISEYDMINVCHFARRVVSLCEFRNKLHHYLSDKMDAVAPNLKALIGDQVGARLIAHAGSLTNLAKAPASTVQILGAEKALFRYALSRLLSLSSSSSCCSLALSPQCPQDARQHAQVRSDLPLDLYRSRVRQEQGPHLALPRQQVLDRLASRLVPRHAHQPVRREVARSGRGAPHLLRHGPHAAQERRGHG